MVSGLLIVTAYVAACSPTLTFCTGKLIVKGTFKLSKYISDELTKTKWSLLSPRNNTTKTRSN